VLPVIPVCLLKEASLCQPHNPSRVLSDIAGEDDVATMGLEQGRATAEEINTVVELVVGKLGEVIL
jgi:hypothetical protein